MLLLMKRAEGRLSGVESLKWLKKVKRSQAWSAFLNIKEFSSEICSCSFDSESPFYTEVLWHLMEDIMRNHLHGLMLMALSPASHGMSPHYIPVWWKTKGSGHCPHYLLIVVFSNPTMKTLLKEWQCDDSEDTKWNSTRFWTFSTWSSGDAFINEKSVPP